MKAMDKYDQGLVNAWLEAASDLGIRVVAPFQFRTQAGETLWCEAHVLDFGSPQGILVGNCESNQLLVLRESDGYAFSHLSRSYRSYSRECFIDMLNDWRWFGETGKEPSWYTGEPETI